MPFIGVGVGIDMVRLEAPGIDMTGFEGDWGAIGVTFIVRPFD